MILLKSPILFITLLLIHLKSSVSFVPWQIINSSIEKLDERLKLDFGMVSKSIAHNKITRNGLVRSVALYFYEQKGGSQKIKLDDMDRYTNDTMQLYMDFYGSSSLSLNRSAPFIKVAASIGILAGLVDLDPKTGDMPYAHFDAEKFKESNRRVIELMAQLNVSIAKGGDYADAHMLSAQVLHTIQDFYSHSNWVESGNKNINAAIGSVEFENQLAASPTDPDTCNNNCELITVQCSFIEAGFVEAIKFLKHDFVFSCPTKYYKCSGNFVMLNKLVSGYYTNQKLPDGTEISNPGNLNKCNHGGLLDVNSYSKQALGGVNKDTGMYLLSPHAHLHKEAALLAELHTEYFFNSIRKNFGDEKFAKFLSL